jgi:hypothetical protein
MPRNQTQPRAPVSRLGRRVVFALPVDVDALRWGHADLGGPQARLLALAHALCSTPLSAEMPEAALVVRHGDRPLFGVIGCFDDAAAARVEALARQLPHALSRLRYVGYEQAERDGEQLAARLIERFGREHLSRARFVAIPRGGLIVLGMLSYLLDLRPDQLEDSGSSDAPLVVVDDCALSGARFRDFLRRCGGGRVIFGHLYSHPELRAAIEAREPSVRACVAARDLTDHAPKRLGDGYETWQRSWQERSDGRGYWVGQPDHVCFAWSEPDITFWNAVTHREEVAWRVTPPSLCLKNRREPGSERRFSVQVQPEGKGPLRPPASVIFGELEGRIVVGNVETGASVSLADTAADLWRAVVEHGEPAAAARALSEIYATDEAALRADLDRLIERWLALGLLETTGANAER